MSEILRTTPTAEELERLVYPERTPEQTTPLARTAFEALVLDTDTRIEDKALVTTGTEYTMPEGDTNK